jgi:ubiquinol-cytochrome c reductase cytochrome b subunit
VRSSISRWFFEDRLTPLTQAELEAAVAHQHHSLAEMRAVEDAEIHGAHERAGHPEAPLRPEGDDTRTGEIPVRPTSILAEDDNPERDGEKG